MTINEVDEILRIPMRTGLRVAPDGLRVVCSAFTLAPGGDDYACALWEESGRGWRRLTPLSAGPCESAFLPDGSLVFTGAFEQAPPGTLWLLPAPGGPAMPLLTLPGGVMGLSAASQTAQLTFASKMMPAATTLRDDERMRAERERLGLNAVLRDRYPVDSDSGDPAEPRILVARLTMPWGAPGIAGIVDLTPPPDAKVSGPAALSPDGRFAVYPCHVEESECQQHAVLFLTDIAAGSCTTIADEPGVDFEEPSFSPDGRFVVCVRQEQGTYDDPTDAALWLIDMSTRAGRGIATDFPYSPTEPVFATNGESVYFVADDHGHRPIFRAGVDSESVTRLTTSGGYSDLCPAPNGKQLFALRAHVDHPPRPVILDPAQPDQHPRRTSDQNGDQQLPGSLTEIHATAEDGTPLRSWLLTPSGGGRPAPLVVWAHGGPMMSANTWPWPRSPWPLVARGYAVLLPDPAMSSGYGRDFLRRGWGRWSEAPCTDLLTLTDAACERPDIDGERCALIGISFGGYLANWISTKSSRYSAVVSHGGPYNIPAFIASHDEATFWIRQMGDPVAKPDRYRDTSPHLYADQVTTPALVIHGGRDHRVPLAEGIRHFFDLKRRDVEAHFLYFADGDHMLTDPVAVRIWHDTICGFLGEKLLGVKWEHPALL